MFLDNGAFHKAKGLKIPENIVLIFLPPYSPVNLLKECPKSTSLKISRFPVVNAVLEEAKQDGGEIFRQKVVTFRQKITTFMQNSTTFMQNSTTFRQNSTTFTQNSTTFRQKITTFTQNSTTFMQNSTTFTQNSTTFTMKFEVSL